VRCCRRDTRRSGDPAPPFDLPLTLRLENGRFGALRPFVQKGTPFAAVSAEPTEPHLHFELWAVVDRAAAGDSDLVPLDPTRAL
jgi:hypothetical protein